MTIEVTAPDGSIVSFPDNMDEASIHKAMLQHFGGGPQSSEPPAPFSMMQTHEVPRPGAGGNYGLDITQRARNTAFGQGPGSVAEIPGAGLPLAMEGVGAIGGGLAKGFRALPAGWQTFIASSGALAASEAAKHLGAPESVTKWLEDAGLVRMFGKHP